MAKGKLSKDGVLSSSYVEHQISRVSTSLFLSDFLDRPFTKLKECSSGSGRPNISRSSSSTSSFSSTTGETEALEELETVSATLTVQEEKVY